VELLQNRVDLVSHGAGDSSLSTLRKVQSISFLKVDRFLLAIGLGASEELFISLEEKSLGCDIAIMLLIDEQ
jgi:hypothetical protein